jgi:hypothetical protein
MKTCEIKFELLKRIIINSRTKQVKSAADGHFSGMSDQNTSALISLL